MLEIIYRIYEVSDEEKNDDSRIYYGISRNKEITMDCKICESRDLFKDLIRQEYGDTIAFRNHKKLNPGDLYCIIIAENCYNTERYFNRIEYVCANCGNKVTGFIDKSEKIIDWEIRNDLCNQIEKYNNLRFCSCSCKNHFIKQEKQKCMDDEMIDESYITRDTFYNDEIAGYIYKISKKSTGEFYIGQTIYLPIFRWGQHLKTDRFSIEHITDYEFEVIEVVPISENILDREKFYIQEYYKNCPDKSLNIMCTKVLGE